MRERDAEIAGDEGAQPVSVAGHRAVEQAVLRAQRVCRSPCDLRVRLQVGEKVARRQFEQRE